MTATTTMISHSHTGRPRKMMFQNVVGFRTVIVCSVGAMLEPAGLDARILCGPSMALNGINSPVCHEPSPRDVAFAFVTGLPFWSRNSTSIGIPGRASPPAVSVTNPSTRIVSPGAYPFTGDGRGFIEIVPDGGWRFADWFAQLFASLPSAMLPNPVEGLPFAS